MLVWERIAAGSKPICGKKIDLDYIYNWLNKFDIKACDLQREVKYLENDLQCTQNCSQCLLLYLGTDVNQTQEKTNTSECVKFKSVLDEMGEQQLVLF
ncbi:MAG: hypothetical protein ACI3T9_02225 [Romboutsia timonensis]